jgi:hypothetical protein
MVSEGVTAALMRARLSKLQRSLAALAVGNQEICKNRVCQQRHMTKNVVKNVRFLEIVQLFLRSDEGTGRKAPVGEVIKENVVGDEFGHRHDAPASDLFKTVA